MIDLAYLCVRTVSVCPSWRRLFSFRRVNFGQTLDQSESGRGPRGIRLGSCEADSSEIKIFSQGEHNRNK